ncbi:MAG TPA: YHYH domain-containing protein [Microvirga sp.]|nr:YHYH domain-containing protein [Microvirga sp.]
MKAIIAGVLASLLATAVLAHGGGLDKNGCHHDRKKGGYHCHR